MFLCRLIFEQHIESRDRPDLDLVGGYDGDCPCSDMPRVPYQTDLQKSFKSWPYTFREIISRRPRDIVLAGRACLERL